MNIFNPDKQSDINQLLEKGPVGTVARNTPYGSISSVPLMGDFPDMLIDEKDYKEVIEFCHREKIFSFYHQDSSWCPNGTKWNQNGLNFCWAWGITAALMDQRAKEGKETKLLAPVSLGWLVNWKNRGNYLESAVEGLSNRGVCEAEFVPNQHSPNPREFKAGWEENALKYRLNKNCFYDTDNSSKKSMIQHCISGLRNGGSVYVAFNWWGHALEVVAVEWDESKKNNLIWWLRNSHNESEIIKMEGDKAVPDEAFILMATENV